MTSKHNKQKKDCNIWYCIVKKIQNSYYRFKEMLGFENSRNSLPTDDQCSSNTESVSTASTPSPTNQEEVLQPSRKIKSSANSVNNSKKRKPASKRKKSTKKTPSSVTKK